MLVERTAFLLMVHLRSLSNANSSGGRDGAEHLQKDSKSGKRRNSLGMELNVPEKDVEQLLISLILGNRIQGHIDQVNALLESGDRDKRRAAVDIMDASD